MKKHELESRLLAETVDRLDLTEFCVVTADTSVRVAVERMRLKRQNCAFIVGEGTRLLGILTDRDVLKRIVSSPEVWDQPVQKVMTPSPDTLPPSASVHTALRLMDQNRYWNVPVVQDNGVILGNVTYFSILRFLTDHFASEIYNLPPDPANYATERDGG